MSGHNFVVTAALVVSLIAPRLVYADTAETPYKGKTVTIVTSTGPGGTYDVLARTLAHHMARYIPGNPTMIVQNMPGGGNVLATNYMYTIAPKDGTTIATVENGIPLHQVLDGQGVRYDASKFNWLGSPMGAENQAVFAWNTAGMRTLEDAMEREVTVGGTGAGSSIVIYPIAMNAVLGTKFKIVMGYKSSEEVTLALQRGEVQARSDGLNTIARQHPDWIKDKTVDFLAVAGLKRDKLLPDVPLATEFAKTAEDRETLRLICAPTALGRPYLAPPGVPAERLAILRSAFMATVKDKEFVNEAQKLRIDIDPMGPDEVTKVVADTIGAPPAVIAKAKIAMGITGSSQ
jgi:tripartite-type tricarboxylate transporter receptor subunit TctC